MSRRVIGYPTGWTLAVFDDLASAEAAGRAVVDEAGVDEGSLVMLHGPQAHERLERLGTSAGLAARIRRIVQFITMDQFPDLHVYELAIAQGLPVLGVHVFDTEARRRVTGVLLRDGGHFVNRFGAWATEEIAPWRGRMPDLPDHLQR